MKHARKSTHWRISMSAQGHALAICATIIALPGISKDLGILTRMLYAAFLAEQGTAICAVADPTFGSDITGSMGDIHGYVQHIKAEVTAGLNETEALSLLKSAADIAKAESQRAIKGLRADGAPEIETARVAKWCEVTVKPLVRQVIDTHDKHHAEIEQLLERAKSN